MKVKEFINLLQDFNPEAEVLGMHQEPLELHGWYSRGDVDPKANAESVYFSFGAIKEDCDNGN